MPFLRDLIFNLRDNHCTDPRHTEKMAQSFFVNHAANAAYLAAGVVEISYYYSDVLSPTVLSFSATPSLLLYREYHVLRNG